MSRSNARNPGDPIAEGMKRAVVEHYERRLERFGPTARGMDWRDEESQRLRFEVLCGICDLRDKTVYDVGAGAGHLCSFLREREIPAKYSGSDLSGRMVEAARTLHPGVEFERRDILADPPAQRYDVVLCSGLFHVKLDHDEDAWRRFVEATLSRMYEMCRLGIAFNLMSDQVDFRSDDLYYAAPGEILDFCRRELSRHVVLRHDYPLYEHTTYVYRRSPFEP